MQLEYTTATFVVLGGVGLFSLIVMIVLWSHPSKSMSESIQEALR